MTRRFRPLLALLAVFALVSAACGDDDDAATGTAAPDDAPTVVVTTNIVGDVVENLVGAELHVVTIMPVGADPHDFAPSAQEVAQIGDADVLITNGAGFEEGLLDVIEAAESDGVPVYEAISAVETIEVGEGGHDEDEDHDEDEGGHVEDHDDEDGHDEDEDHDDHEHSGDDPHFFTDPARMAVAAAGIADFLIDNVDGIDSDALRASADAYIAELEALDAEVAATLAGLSDDQRVLITNHAVFGYFADNYDFEVVGTVIPSGSTVDSTSARELAELAEVIEAEGVRTIFSDTSSPDELIDTLADEVGDIAVVQLFTESLGEAGSGGGTYLEMVRTNAERIAAALAA